ncbi:MAG: outer membrane lipoprotein carrier protein LolA [Pseudonocardia sp.]|nr:outer membrane lipoprotein carrier protein LolA [Pseudonocardia sp.]
MANRRTDRTGRNVAAGIAVAGVVGLGLLAVPAGAGAAPVLPPVAAEELVSSVLTAEAGAFGGTVELDNGLGLPALPGVPQAANGTSTARVWSDGEGRGRVQVPTGSGERTLVSDGETFWSWDSATRTVTKVPEGDKAHAAPEAAATDPTAAATQAIEALSATSQISVDGTAEVAGRAAYELVLAPAPSERTLLREVRIAVDAEKRVPLRLTVLANGSTDPVLQLGFTDLAFGAQDAKLFTFTPPAGSTVDEPQIPDGARTEAKPDVVPAVVGDGWDTVVVASMPTPAQTPAPTGEDRDDQRFGGGAMDPSALGTPVSGAWGSGTLISTAVANAIITDDGRVAAGAVPEQVLTEALAR